jgi:hypothetical protein
MGRMRRPPFDETFIASLAWFACIILLVILAVAAVLGVEL